MTTLYGINNCDTVKKARKWLDDNGKQYTFHDFRKDGITEQQVQKWVAALGWETLINKRSTTWKELDEPTRAALNDSTVIAVVVQHPTLIKRPLLESADHIGVGFKAADYQTLFN